MAKFRPVVGLLLALGKRSFEFVAHPLFPEESDEVFVMEGGEAFIYQIREVTTRSLYALKIVKPAYRSEHIARVTETVRRASDLPGFHLHHRICLTMAEYPDLLKIAPDLEYAVLMPWLVGKTWSGLMLDQAASARYTLQQASTIAAMVAQLLHKLESRHLAHADIAGGNLFLSPDLQRVQLLDLEGLYLPGAPPPPFCSQGTPGYQHHHLGPQGQWCLEGDRFAGAILLTEMLTWWNPRVRACVADHAETLFQPAELQMSQSPRWREVRNTLWSIHPGLLSLFDQVWFSSSLAECPDFASWSRVLAANTKFCQPTPPPLYAPA